MGFSLSVQFSRFGTVMPIDTSNTQKFESKLNLLQLGGERSSQWLLLSPLKNDYHSIYC